MRNSFSLLSRAPGSSTSTFTSFYRPFLLEILSLWPTGVDWIFFLVAHLVFPSCKADQRDVYRIWGSRLANAMCVRSQTNGSGTADSVDTAVHLQQQKRQSERETSRRINILFRFPLRKRLRHAIYLFYFCTECSLAGPQRQARPAVSPVVLSSSLPPTMVTLAALAALVDRRLLTYDYHRREAS